MLYVSSLCVHVTVLLSPAIQGGRAIIIRTLLMGSLRSREVELFAQGYVVRQLEECQMGWSCASLPYPLGWACGVPALGTKAGGLQRL